MMTSGNRTFALGDSPVLRVPVDGTAARVISPGFKYTPDKDIRTADQALPFTLRPFTYAMRKNKVFTDLTGRRFGRLTVLGLSEKPGRWACRCDCGTYTLRSGSAVTKPTNDRDRCDECRHLAYLQRADEFRQTGRNKPYAP